jgi:hypothetical protein
VFLVKDVKDFSPQIKAVNKKLSPSKRKPCSQPIPTVFE